MNQPFSKGYIPTLDGLRALSVLLVLFAHASPPHLRATAAYFCGALGVRFFFVISGFLITWLLLREINLRTSINMRAFYLRRVFRILPVYFCFLLVYFILEIGAERKIDTWQWIANLTLTANYSAAAGPSGHLWTLGVEEQFYILWPIFFAAGFRSKRLVRFAVAALVLCPVFRGISFLFASEELPLVLHRFSFLRHADVIGWGCLAAIYMWQRPGLWERIAAIWLPLTGVGSLMVLAPWFTGHMPGFSLVNVPLTPTVQAVGFALIMLCGIKCSGSLPFAWFNTAPARILGVLSYSIYIWHPLVSPNERGWPTLMPESIDFPFFWMVPAIGLAALSYWGLEKPFLRLRRKFGTHN